MKVVLILAMAICSVYCQQQVNPLQSCLVDIRSSGDKILKTAVDVVSKNPMGILEIIGALKELQESVANCKKVQAQDALMWIDQHANAQEKDCLQKFIAFMMDIKQLESAAKTHDQAQIMTATVKLIQDLDTAWNGCMAFF